uniref:Reverse transcriptase domain-containing protein n=1 Tax=Aegilops tauschii subsp. strangulata TaxID=200361 RepID=A0A453PEI5_AEGTS
MPAGKAPGPDGFTAEFLRACWPIIKADTCAVFDKLYARNGRGFRKLNEAFLTLLPKKPDACRIADYRPISLIHLLA